MPEPLVPNLYSRMGRAVLSAGVALFISGCATHWMNAQRTFEPDRLKAVKRVAIMPFFTTGLTTDDPSYHGKFSAQQPSVVVYEALKEGHRFHFIDQDKVTAALKKAGFEGIRLAPGEDVSILKAMFNPGRYRTGYTLQQARAAGKALKADALLIGSYGMSFNSGPGGGSPKVVMALRFVSPKDGSTLWGAAKSEESQASIFHPIDSQKQQIAQMAQELIAEVP